MNKPLLKSVGSKRGQYKMGKHRTAFSPKCSRSSNLRGGGMKSAKLNQREKVEKITVSLVESNPVIHTTIS